MYNCNEDDIIKFDADFNDEFDSILIDLISKCKRIYFLDQKGFGIKSIFANSKFNRVVDVLPKYITHIKFGYEFNQKVENLPHNLLWLEFGYKFNQNIDMLPQNITYLVFGNSFNKNVDDLPNDLIYVSFGNEFNQPINSLPKSLIYINIGSIQTPFVHGRDHSSKFKHLTYNIPKKINNIIICLNNTKYPIKTNFIERLNYLVMN